MNKITTDKIKIAEQMFACGMQDDDGVVTSNLTFIHYVELPTNADARDQLVATTHKRAHILADGLVSLFDVKPYDVRVTVNVENRSVICKIEVSTSRFISD